MRVSWLRSILLEAVFLISITVVISGLYLIPTILYALPSAPEKKTSTSQGNCSQVANYSGDICRNELASLKACYSGDAYVPGFVSIPASTDQAASQLKAAIWLNALPLLAPSQECIERLNTFFCLHAFEVCDANGTVHRPTMKDCLEVRDTLCPSVWSRAIDFLGDGVLPVCEALPNITDECTESTLQLNQSSENECNGQFFFNNDTQTCRPICGEYLARPQIYKQVVFSFGFASSILVIVLAIATQKKKVLQFPSALLMYMNITALVMSLFAIIGFFDNTALYCGSMDLLEALNKGNETSFCTITGLIFAYGMIQLSVWTVLYIAFLLQAISCPYTFRKMKILGTVHYLHAASVAFAILFPLPFGLAFLKDGFMALAHPTFFCSGRNADHVYFALMLPMSILLGIATVLLFLLFWLLLKDILARSKGSKGKSKNNITIFGSAEGKVIVALVYFIIFGIMMLVLLTLSQLRTEQFQLKSKQDVNSYVVCAASQDCTRLDGAEIITTTQSLSSVTVVMLACLPVIILILSINFRICAMKLKNSHCAERVARRWSHTPKSMPMQEEKG